MPATAFLGEQPIGGLAGLACAPHSRETEQQCSAIDGTPLGNLPVGTPEDLAEAVGRIRDAQRAWAAMPASFRLAPFRRFAGLLAAYRQPIAAVLRAETGLEPATVETMVADSGPQSLRAARDGIRALRSRRRRTGWRTTAVERFEPRGVVGLVADPGLPFDPVTATAALVAGNGVLLVPTLRSGFTALSLAQLLAASRLPDDLVQVVPGRPELAAAAATVVDQLVVGPRPDPLDFTTSTVVPR